MDYGQSAQPSNSGKKLDFFTSGDGIDIEKEGISYDLDNLNSNDNTDWNKPNDAMNVHRQPSETEPSESHRQHTENKRGNVPSENKRPVLGQIAPTMPPGYSEPKPTDASSPNALSNFSFRRNSAMTGDRLSDEALSVIQNQERALSDNGDVAEFFNFVSEAREEFCDKGAA